MKQLFTFVILTTLILALSLESHGCATGGRTNAATPTSVAVSKSLALAAAAKPLTLPRIQDDFAELDDTIPTMPFAGSSDRFIMTTLESARQHYLRALSYINRSDTAKAARAFEQAIETLNKISNLPKIEENPDFTDLMQSIIDDYENHIQSIDNLNENSPIFVLRDKFFQEVDKDATVYNELSFAKDKEPRSTLTQLKLPESSSALTKIIGMKGVPLQIPMTDNEFVQKTIEFFTNDRGRRYFQKWLQRAGRWFPMMRKIAKEEGAPEEIIYLSMIESGLSPFAQSPAKAVGLWQFMKSTGNLYGLEAGYWTDERRDPEKATRAAMRHLKDLYNEFGDWHLAMAAYNCGVGGTRRAIARSGVSNPDYWEIRGKLPRETRNYVPLYIAAAKVAMNPEAYGFINIPLEEAYDYDTVEINESADFRALAGCTGISADELEFLNPEILRSSTPPSSNHYELKIPKGKKEIFAANYEKLDVEDKHSWALHEVTGSETLYSIAKKYNVSANVIAAANELSGKKKRLPAGTILRIPTDGKYTEGVSEEDEVAHASSSGASGSKEPKERDKDITHTSPVPANSKKVTHEIRSGETLYNIATRYGVRLADLRNWNNIPYNSDKVALGEQLTIYVDKNRRDDEGVDANAIKPVKTVIIAHVVKKGETLAKIADDYEVSMNDIRTSSSMKKRDKIFVGQTLKIAVAANSTQARNDSRDTRTEEPHKQSVATTAPNNGRYSTYTVKKGESVSDIASRYGVNARDIAKWNPSAKGERLAAGTELKIFGQNTAKGSAAASEDVSGKSYVVKPGDTLFSIAKKYGLSVSTMTKLNKGLSENKLALGQKLRVAE